MKKLSISMVVVALVVGNLNAGGKLVEIPKVPPKQIVVDEWSGPYIGLQAGYITGKAKVDISESYVTIGTLTHVTTPTTVTQEYDTLTLEPDGFIGGLFFGYNKKFENNFLLGIEGALNYTNIKDTEKITQDDVDMEREFTLKQQNEAALYLRAGYVMDDTFMPYLLGGVTWTKLKGGLKLGSQTLWDSDTVTGWTLGAGVEYKINRNWHARVQYRYSRYKEAKFKWQDGTEEYNGKTDKYKTHSIMFGVSYNF